ncbi:sulfurtransferase TusA family protein [Orenia marismortui]|uniref:sulfurtransferase TusA family protein n=1 Tax=Orenia marismortui TaxID=46469 RepID=UPI000367E8F8|nr:sulfurtransferase TusA family protein [Orenia marismortui]
MSNRPIFNISATVKEDTNNYPNLVERFVDGDLDEARFKGRRVPMGIYSQRGYKSGKERYMVRVRIPGGVVTKEQLKVLNQLSKEYGNAYLHITTRQDIQLHQLKIEDTPEVLFKLLEAGLSPRGGGGNTVRNILNSARAGVNPEEAFDTTPHNLALTEYLIKTRSSFNLPRKYKIAFSSDPKDDSLATLNDLGFIATKKDGQRGFKVYGGGGMGGSSELGIVLEDFVEEDKIFHIAEAIKRFFDEYGDRSNKHRARLRFVRKRLGDKEFVNKYKEYLAEVLAEDLEVEELNSYEELRTGKGEKNDLNVDYLYTEKVEGYYSLELRMENGDISYDELNSLLGLLDNSELSIRTTIKQGLLIRGIKGEDLQGLIEKINQINPNLVVANMGTMPVSCKGASTCKLGLCISPNLSEAIRERLMTLDDKLQSVLPQIYISGCPNVCGQHIIANLGFEGKAKRHNDRLLPYYALFLGGNVEEGNSKYGDAAVDIPAKRIPDFLAELARLLAEDGDYNRVNFNTYLEKGGKTKIVELAEEFIAIPTYEEDSDIYKDWGKTEDFSLAGRGPGECGAGVMDIIKLDIDTAKSNYKKAIKEEDDDELYKAIINSSRALLAVRGIDTDKDRVILAEFKTEFIDKNLVDNHYNETLNAALDYKLGDIDNLFSYQNKINNLIERVEYLFNSLNAKLEFELEEVSSDNNNEDKNILDSEVADLRGVKCPMNFVKAKVALAPLNSGDILDIYLDEGEPIANVPQSLISEGHEVLSKEKREDGSYSLKVKKV